MRPHDYGPTGSAGHCLNGCGVAPMDSVEMPCVDIGKVQSSVVRSWDKASEGDCDHLCNWCVLYNARQAHPGYQVYLSPTGYLPGWPRSVLVTLKPRVSKVVLTKRFILASLPGSCTCGGHTPTVKDDVASMAQSKRQ